jgi:hypothetical protein
MKSFVAAGVAVIVVALLAVPFAGAQNPTFALGLLYSTSKMNSSGETRFCIRVTTRPAQPHHLVIVTVGRAKHGAAVKRMQGRFNRRGNWVGRIVLGTKRHPARGPYVYEVSTAGHYTGANQGGPTLSKAFDSGIGGAPICTTPG